MIQKQMSSHFVYKFVCEMFQDMYVPLAGRTTNLGELMLLVLLLPLST